MFPGRSQSGGTLEIGDEGALGRRAVARHDLSRQDVDRVAADDADVVERLREQRVELLLAPGHGADAEHRAVGARTGVDTEHDELVARRGLLNRHRRHFERKLKLGRLEAAGRRSVDAREQGKLGKEQSEIGGKARHEGLRPV